MNFSSMVERFSPEMNELAQNLSKTFFHSKKYLKTKKLQRFEVEEKSQKVRGQKNGYA